jgi:hypothetical protein
VKNIRSLKRFHIRDMTGYRDMARATMYLLSHAAYQPKQLVDDGHAPQTVTYWGEVHPNSFNPEEELTAAEWGRIQDMAKRAVTTRPGEVVLDEIAGESERMPCPREGCEGHVVPIDKLRAWLNDDEWLASISRQQRRILVGVDRWLDNLGDRPPPSTNRARIREWLEDEGRKQERYEQSRLSASA